MMLAKAGKLKEGGGHELVSEWVRMAGSWYEDVDDMDSEEWMDVGGEKERGRGRRQREGCKDRINKSQKRGLEENSVEENERMVWRKMDNEDFKVILMFRREDEHIRLSPIALTQLKKKLGEVEMAKILRDGNIMIKSKTEEQRRKALLIGDICKKKVAYKKM